MACEEDCFVYSACAGIYGMLMGWSGDIQEVSDAMELDIDGYKIFEIY